MFIIISVVSFTNVINAWAALPTMRQKEQKNQPRNQQRGGRRQQQQQESHAKRAQIVLEKMEELYMETKDPDLKLNTIIMNSVMGAWAKESKPENALAILKRMEILEEEQEQSGDDNSCRNPADGVFPNSVSMNIVLKAYANAHQVKQAESFLKQMEEKYVDNNGSSNKTNAHKMPNTRTYNILLSVYASPQYSSSSGNNKNPKKPAPEDAAIKAEKILTKLVSHYSQQQKNSSSSQAQIQPDVVSFTTTMNCIAKSNTYPHKAKRARQILLLMRNLSESQKVDDFLPNIITCNTVLNACAFSAYRSEAERQEAFLIGLKTFNELRSPASSTTTSTEQQTILQPDEVTYGNMIKICANLLTKENPKRTKTATQLFSDCAKRGLIGNLVWNEMKRAVSVDVFQEQVTYSFGDEIKIASTRKDLPFSWRENVREDKDEKRKLEREQRRLSKQNKEQEEARKRRQAANKRKKAGAGTTKRKKQKEEEDETTKRVRYSENVFDMNSSF